MELYTKDKKKLNTGAEVPMLGFGTCGIPSGKVKEAVKTALKAGYRHIDTAAEFDNEEGIGQGIKESGIKREEIFITSKLWNNKHHPDQVESALDQSLTNLGTDYVDLYLMHWPASFDPVKEKDDGGRYVMGKTDYVDTYRKMEALLGPGKVKAIGISNFSIKETKRILENASIAPAMHQIETHPYLMQKEFVEFLDAKKIARTAYLPFGNQYQADKKGAKKLFEHQVVIEIARKYNKEPAQVLISYAIKRGMCVIPRSVKPKHIESNFQDFKMEDGDFKKLNDLDEKLRFNFLNCDYDFFADLNGV